MRRPQRLIAAAILVALSGALAGCGGGGLGNFDPTDMLDFLDTKKKLPGERKPVFPEGVPGLEQGVPKDLYRGANQQVNDPNAQAAAAAAPPPEEPKSKRGAKSKGKQAAAPAAADPDAAPEEEGSTAAAPPAPKPARIARKRTTAPPDQSAAPAQSSQQSAFPAPMPSGSFSR
ncbi:hypothetical protein [Bradyrhizobium sp. sBnM-33]|uniref:hypothetical protein n=1 Tax=Bradyrhizobium sp. sBnM-33 TaxID=2831780 RepID=UPI001BD0C81B|nr:hypothetical protein [Bradyrhizobium sp. sBnM-33]WOH48048.1 hypothetical protein RX328_28385 [Bradyrhizobium sp. sBnM-33]